MQRSCKFKSRLQKAGFTLLEILLVIAVVGILATLAVSQVKKQAENKRINRVATQFQYVMEAAVAYEVQGNRKWPPANDPGKADFINHFLPNGSIKSALGEDFSWYGVYSDGSTKQPLFTVYLKIPGADPMKTAQQIAAQLPNATVTQNKPTPPQQPRPGDTPVPISECTSGSTCYVKAQVPIPATIDRGNTFVNGLCSTLIDESVEYDNGSSASCLTDDIKMEVANNDFVLIGDSMFTIKGNCPANYHVDHLSENGSDFSTSINGFSTLSPYVLAIAAGPDNRLIPTQDPPSAKRNFLIPMELDTLNGLSRCEGKNAFTCNFHLRGLVLEVPVKQVPPSEPPAEPEYRINWDRTRIFPCNRGAGEGEGHASCHAEISYSIRCVPDGNSS